jgi:hypothetical protein
MAKKAFRAEILDMGPALAIELEDALLELLGGKAVPVKVTINGVTFRARTAVMGGRQLLGINKANRTATGVEAGQVVRVTIENDNEPRVIEAPPELVTAFKKNKAARATWDGLSYTHQREYAEWITGAKKAETRERRAAKAIEMLTAGDKTPR